MLNFFKQLKPFLIIAGAGAFGFYMIKFIYIEESFGPLLSTPPHLQYYVLFVWVVLLLVRNIRMKFFIGLVFMAGLFAIHHCEPIRAIILS